MSESTLEQVKRMAQGLSLGERVTLVDELESVLRALTSIQRFVKLGMSWKC
jgi:uncharacterized protein YoaH (UPF0181 family)